MKLFRHISAPFRWIAIASFAKDSSADRAKEILDEAEVPCFLARTQYAFLHYLCRSLRQVRLCVPDDHVKKAMTILNERRRQVHLSGVWTKVA